MTNGNDFVNGLRLYQGPSFSGLVDENTLTRALMKQPYAMGTLVSYVFGAEDSGYSSTLDFITGGLGNVKEIPSSDYEWSFLMEQDRAITINKAMWNGIEIDITQLNSTPGIHMSTIKLWLEEKYFGVGTILEFDDKRYQARVQKEPYQDGKDWVYSIVISGEYANSYIMPNLLLPGTMVSRAGSAYEEYSNEADILNYDAPFKLRNHLTTMRLDYNITGSANSDILAIELQDPKTKQSTFYWSPYQGWKALREWTKRVDYQLMHEQYHADSVGTMAVAGTNGRPVFRGAGLRQQISPANRRYYSHFNLRMLEDYLIDLSYNILGTSERKFLGLTGDMGAMQFDRAVKEESRDYQLIDTKFVTGSGSEMTFGGQFTTYKMSGNIEFTIKVCPGYNDTVHNRTLHPITKKPIEAYRYTILDIGRRDGKSNILKVFKKDRGFEQWHTDGSTTPDGKSKGSANTMRSNAKDGYSVHFLGEQGIMLVDPRGCGELIMELS